MEDPGLSDSGISLQQHIVRNTVANGSIGGEVIFFGWLPLRAGFFTDFAAAPTPELPEPVDPPTNSTHLNRYGGTLSLGYLGEHASVDVGTILAYATGQTILGSGTSARLTDESMLSSYFFLSSAYEF